MKLPNPWAEAWAHAERSGPLPTRIRSSKVVDWTLFAESVRAQDPAFVSYLVGLLYAGDIVILKNAFPRNFMVNVRWLAARWMRFQEPSFHQMLEGSPDFHRYIDPETGKKYSFECCKQAAYFYRWNDDPLGLWPAVTERWRVAKVAMGLAFDEYEAFTPRDGVVDRVQIVRYPPAIGFLEPHADPHLHQRCFFSGYLSRRGVDYQGGGFYAVNSSNEAVFLEDQIDVGDAALGYATVCHGVAPCEKPLEPSSDDGRWFLSLYSNASDEVPNRHTGRPEKVSVAGVLPL